MPDKKPTYVADNNGGKMTDNEIVKILNNIISIYDKDETQISGIRLITLLENALDSINRLQAENEMLNKEVDRLSQVVLYNDGVTEMKVEEAKAEAYKECIEKAKKEIYQQPHSKGMEETRERCRIMQILDNLLKELVIKNDIGRYDPYTDSFKNRG